MDVVHDKVCGVEAAGLGEEPVGEEQPREEEEGVCGRRGVGDDLEQHTIGFLQEGRSCVVVEQR